MTTLPALQQRASLPASPTPTLDASRYTWLAVERPDQYRALPTPAEEAELRRELTEANEPVPLPALQQAIKRMVGSYPQAGPADPRAYILAAAEHLSEYPADVVAAACREVVRTCRFLPSVAELVEIAEEKVSRRRRALRHLELVGAERDRRQREAEETAAREAENAAWRAADDLAQERFAALVPHSPHTAWRRLDWFDRKPLVELARAGDIAALDQALAELPVVQRHQRTGPWAEGEPDPEAPF